MSSGRGEATSEGVPTTGADRMEGSLPPSKPPQTAGSYTAGALRETVGETCRHVVHVWGEVETVTPKNRECLILLHFRLRFRRSKAGGRGAPCQEDLLLRRPKGGRAVTGATCGRGSSRRWRRMGRRDSGHHGQARTEEPHRGHRHIHLTRVLNSTFSLLTRSGTCGQETEG